MIIVTGANGPFGRLVVEHLIRLVPPDGVVASVRDPAASGTLRDWGVEVRHGDFGEPATLTGAFAGAATVLLNATYYGAKPGVRGPQQAAAVAAARAAGAHVVATGWQDALNCPMPATTDYPATERLVRSGPSWTVLRIGYGLNAALARDVIAARRAGVLTAPAGDARVAAAAPADLAEATARVLAGAAPESGGRVYDLTGPDTVGWAGLAALAGPGIEYRPATAEAFHARSVAAGYPPAVADQLLELYAAFRSGWAGTPTGDLEHLLGRRPAGALDAVQQAVDGWAWS